MRSKLKTKSAIGQLDAANEMIIDNNQERANLMNNYFVSVFQKEESTPLPQFNARQFAHELNTISITEENILKAIDRIKPTKSQGPDNIHPMLIKNVKHPCGLHAQPNCWGFWRTLPQPWTKGMTLMSSTLIFVRPLTSSAINDY